MKECLKILVLSWLSSFEKEEGTAACGGEVVRLFLKYLSIFTYYLTTPPLLAMVPPPPLKRRGGRIVYLQTSKYPDILKFQIQNIHPMKLL